MIGKAYTTGKAYNRKTFTTPKDNVLQERPVMEETYTTGKGYDRKGL